MLPTLARHTAAGQAPVEDRAFNSLQRTYAFLGITEPAGSSAEALPPICTEVSFLTLVPVVIWCVMSWGIAYAGSIHLLAKVQLFAFIPAAATAFACERIRQLRTLPAQLNCLKEENEWFKSSNAELRQGIESLRTENEETQAANRRLQASISGLESVRMTIEAYAAKNNSDFGQVLSDFQKMIAQQQDILESTKKLQKRTRKLTEAQWRALMLNLYAQVDHHEGMQGMSRTEFELWLAMLPVEISEKLSLKTFDEIDADRNGIIDITEMCNWVQVAAKALLAKEGGADPEWEDDEAVDTDGPAAPPVATRSGEALLAESAERRIDSSGSCGIWSFHAKEESPKQEPTNCMGTRLTDRPDSAATHSPSSFSSSVRAFSQVPVSRSMSSAASFTHPRSANEHGLNRMQYAGCSRPSFNDASLKVLFGSHHAVSSDTKNGVASRVALTPTER